MNAEAAKAIDVKQTSLRSLDVYYWNIVILEDILFGLPE
jgi:hypothetical protein